MSPSTITEIGRASVAIIAMLALAILYIRCGSPEPPRCQVRMETVGFLGGIVLAALGIEWRNMLQNNE